MTKYNICKCCGQELVGAERYIGVCTSCVQTKPKRIEIKTPSYRGSK